MVLDTLKALDFYGTISHFNTFKKTDHKTHFGGLLSILTIFAMIDAFVYFGKNFFYRLNPNYLHERKVQANPIMYPMNNSNLFLAFRVEDDYTSGYFNFSQYFQLNAFYEIYQRNQNVEAFNLTSYPLDIVDCSTIIDDNFNYSTPNYTNFSCIKLSNFIVGGYWDNNQVNLIKLKLNYCVNNSYCKNVSEIKKFLKKKAYSFNIYSYETFVDLETKKFNSKPKNMFFSIDSRMSKTKFIYYSLVNLTTDFGILSDMPSTISQISIDHELNDFRIIDESDSDTELINFQFFLLSETDAYTINYIKLTDVFAKLGGISSLINIIFMNIALIYNLYDKEVRLINKVFDFSDLPINVDVVEILSKDKIKLPFYYKSNLSSDKSSLQILDKLEKNVNIIKVDVNDIPEKSNEWINDMSEYFTKVIGKQKSNFKLSPSFYNILCFPKIKNKNKKLIFDIYLKANELITARLDVAEYLRFFDDYKALKKILLGDFSNLCLSLKNKSKLYENQSIVNFPTKTERLKRLLTHFSVNRNTCIEDKFFNILQDTLKNTLLHLSFDKKKDNSLLN